MNQEDQAFFRKLIQEKMDQTNENVSAIEKTSRNEGNEGTSEDSDETALENGADTGDTDTPSDQTQEGN